MCVYVCVCLCVCMCQRALSGVEARSTVCVGQHTSHSPQEVCVCVCVCVCEYLCCVIVAAGLTSSDYKNQRAQQRPSLITPGNVEKFVLTRLHHKKTLLSSQVK